jgi:hypothetical protein
MIRFLIKKESNIPLSENEIKKKSNRFNYIVKEMSKINLVKNEEINLEKIKNKMEEYENLNAKRKLNIKLNTNSNSNSNSNPNSKSNSQTQLNSESISAFSLGSDLSSRREPRLQSEPESVSGSDKKFLNKNSPFDSPMCVNCNNNINNFTFDKNNNIVNNIDNNVYNNIDNNNLNQKIILNFFNFLEKSDKDKFLIEQEILLDTNEINGENYFFNNEKILNFNNNNNNNHNSNFFKNNTNMNSIYKINIKAEFNENDLKNLLMKNLEDEEKIFFGI